MVIALNILPVFFIIALGLLGARQGFFPPGFLGPANRLAYWLAIPALVFKAVATAPLQEAFQPLPALMTIIAILVVWLIALLISQFFYGHQKGPHPARASWIQCSMHSTQASMGLAIVFFALGQQGLNTAGMVAAVISITQNLLAVITLTKLGNLSTDNNSSVWRAVFLNPIIISSTTGLAWSLIGLPMPEFIARILNILGGMGLPLALLIIGAKLSEGKLGGKPLALAVTVFLKLIILPGLGLLLMLPWRCLPDIAVSATILLLASPTAIVAVIMASQMGGDSQLSSEAVTLAYASSAITYGLWLWFLID